MAKSRELVDFLQITLRAEDLFGPIRGIGCLDRPSAGSAGSVKEEAGIAKGEPVLVADIRMTSGEGDFVLAEEAELLLDDAKGTTRGFTFYGPVQDRIRDIIYGIRKLGGLDGSVYHRWW